jgi:hypothetical protein
LGLLKDAVSLYYLWHCYVNNRFKADSFDEEQVEAYIMGCACRVELNVRVDYKDGSITFVDDPFVPNDDSLPSTSESSSTSIALEVSTQPSTTDLVRTRLIRIDVAKIYAQSLVDKVILKPNDGRKFSFFFLSVFPQDG